VQDADGSHLETFHTISRAWAPLPYRNGGRVDSVSPLGNGVLIAHAADGGIAFENAQVISSKRQLAGIDWTIIVCISRQWSASASTGTSATARARPPSSSSAAARFRSGPRAVSLYATNTSSISYIAIPAKAFETDWQYMMSKIMTVLGLMVVAV
jgi:hypothetical protein